MSITKRISTLLVVSVVCTLGFFTGCDWVRWSSRGTSNTADRIKIPPPINALLPQRIEVHPFTRIGVLSERGDIHGIDLCIRAVDSYGDATKAFGKFRFELYQFKPGSPDPKGALLAVWNENIETLKENRRYWDNISRTYRFKLAWDRETLPSEKFVIVVIFQSRYSDRLFAQRVISAE